MRVVALDAQDPNPRAVAEAVAMLRGGGVVALPTETFYGLAADSLSANALARLNRIKAKAADSPILLLAADVAQVERVAVTRLEAFHALAGAFWPGPLTLVLRANRSLPDRVGAGRGTLAIRVPGLVLPRRLAAALGRPISGVSANRHGQPPADDAAAVLRALGDEVDLVLDGGVSPGERPSTILDLTGSTPTVLREGAVPSSELTAYL